MIQDFVFKIPHPAMVPNLPTIESVVSEGNGKQIGLTNRVYSILDRNKMTEMSAS